MDKANSTAKIISLQSIFKFIVVSIFLGLSLWFLRRLSCCSISVFHPISNMAWLLPALVIWFALRWSYLVRSKYAPLLWTFLVFSLLINARFLFYINFYGLYAVTAVILLFALLYQLARETGLVIAKYLLICLLIGASFNLNEFANYRYPVRSAQGVAYTKDEDLAMGFNRTLEVIDSSKANSVLVIPEGSILNFLSQTRTPSRETIFIPGVLPTPDAQIDFLKRMEADLPDLIVYVDVPFFWLKPGYQSYREYNSLVHQWIVRQYRLIHSSKPLDYHGNPWTIRIYGRN